MVGRCRCPHVTLWTGSFALLIIHLHPCFSIDHIWVYRLPETQLLGRRCCLSLLRFPPRGLERDRKRRRRRPTDRQDHLGVRLLRPVPLPCCCRLSAARSNSNLTDHMLRSFGRQQQPPSMWPLQCSCSLSLVEPMHASRVCMHAMRSRPAETPSRVVLVPPVQAFALLGRSRHLDLLRGIHGSHCDRAGGFAASLWRR